MLRGATVEKLDSRVDLLLIGSALLTDREVSALTGRARSTLQKDRLYGGGIPFVRVGRLVRYRPQDLAAWLAALPTRTSTSARA